MPNKPGRWPRAIEDPYGKASALAGVASALAATDAQQARQVAQQARQVAESIEDPSAKASALAGVASALAAPGLAGHAVEMRSLLAQTIETSAQESIDALWETVDASFPGLAVLLSRDELVALVDMLISDVTG